MGGEEEEEGLIAFDGGAEEKGEITPEVSITFFLANFMPDFAGDDIDPDASGPFSV